MASRAAAGELQLPVVLTLLLGGIAIGGGIDVPHPPQDFSASRGTGGRQAARDDQREFHARAISGWV